jgi:hypothetical protein
MSQTRTPLTKDLIRKHFGRDAKVYGSGDRYRVMTRMGGEAVITSRRITPIYGGDEIYRATASLANDLWGGMIVNGNGVARESVLAFVAHCEVLGVNVQPSYRNPWDTFARWFVAIAILCASGYAGLFEDWRGAVGVPLLTLAIFRGMKKKARRMEQRKLEASGFHFPRTTEGAAYATDEQLRKGGLI